MREPGYFADMSLAELKQAAERLSPAERQHLAAHLVTLDRTAESGNTLLPEKLRAMETLWEDISRQPDQVDSPAWHADVLRERAQVGESGQAQFMDWERAKADIRRRLE